MRKLSFISWVYLSILALLLAPPVFAQTNTDQADADADQEAGDIEEVIVTGSHMRGAAISDALSVSVISAEDIEVLGIESGDELLDAMPEQGQNFFNEAENISGGVNSARGDIGAFNLRNIGTGNTLVLMNGRRVVNSATYQTEEVGGSFVPVNTVNSTVIPVFGVERLEVLRDGASAIYGADAVAGVVNTVMKNDYDGFTIRGRYTSWDDIPRDAASATIEWGKLFNGGRTAVGIFGNYLHRDRVNSQDDDKWADSDYRRFIPEDSPWDGDTRFRNNSVNSNWGQYDVRKSMTGDPYGLVGRGIVDTNGEFETYPFGDERCEGGYIIADNVCGHADGQGVYRYNLNDNRDLASKLDRYNVYAYLNHEFDNGVVAYTEFSWYQSKTNLIRHPSYFFSTLKHRVSADQYWNPLGPCGSPNRLPDSVIGPDVPCEGLELEIDNYRVAEVPRIVDTKGKVFRILQGFSGSIGLEWDWDSAIIYSKATRHDVTRNRVSNNLMKDALTDPTPAAYNPFGGGVGTNFERTLIDVRRDSETDLKLIDFKISNIGLFDIWGGPVGFLAGAEYRKESFEDDRDPHLDGTIPYTSWQGKTDPFVSDVVNSSPTPDTSGSRNVFSLFTEFALPMHSTLDVQVAFRYENFSDVGSTVVPKIAFGWRPMDWFMLRGSWSEAFRAPNLVTINEQLVVRNNTRNDWACTYAADFGGDPDQDTVDCINSTQRRATGSDDLKPEKSDNYSIGTVLQPLDNLTLTIDFWRIKKKDTIGLFGEENHTLVDLLDRLNAGTGNCVNFQGNPAVTRDDPDADVAEVYLAAGICPAGDIDYISDRYQNLDTRKTEGFDFGVYYDLESGIGDWTFTWVGTVYTTYFQEGNEVTQLLEDAKCTGADQSGCIPINYPIAGIGDLIRINGNQKQKMNARVRWMKDGWGASVAWFYLSDFIQDSLDIDNGDGTLTRWVVPSMSTWNLSADYRFDLWNSLTSGISPMRTGTMAALTISTSRCPGRC